jgi:hypothetical protein
MLQWVWDFFFGGVQLTLFWGPLQLFGGSLQLFEAPAMAR